MDTKKIVAPLQQWLLGQGRCVGCGRPLSQGRKKPVDGVYLVTCQCQRVFVQDRNAGSYRRALFEEIEQAILRQ